MKARLTTMNIEKRELYQAAQILSEAFSYLQPRMQGGWPLGQPMNAEALAGCLLHACMAKLMGEIRRQEGGGYSGLTA
jgi:hypothetical protein